MISFTYLGRIIDKDDKCSENVKITIAQAQDIFPQLKKVQKNRKISLRAKIRVLQAVVMKEIKHRSESMNALKDSGGFLDVFRRNCLKIILGTHLTD